MPRLSRHSKVFADKTKPRHEKTIIIQGIPSDTKEAFKSACALNGKTMRDVFIELMRNYAVESPNPHL